MTPTSETLSSSGSVSFTPLPAYLVEFDLDTVLEYAQAISNAGVSNKANISKGSRTNELPSTPDAFAVVQRNWVASMKSPILLDSDHISQYLGGGNLLENDNHYKISIDVFDFKIAKPGEPSVILHKRQRGNIKKGALFTMQVVDQATEAEISAEIYFIVSRLKKCKPHFSVSGLNLEIDLFPATNSVAIKISYKLELLTSFYRYFSSDIVVALDNIVRPKMEITPSNNDKYVSSFEGQDKDSHLFYKVITGSTSRMPSISQPFEHPSLRTHLLPFQRKSVHWLLSQENVEYDQDSRKCVEVSTISSEMYQALVSYPHIDCEWLHQQIDRVFAKLCFGWRRIRYFGEVCWYNNYTGNLMLASHAVQFLRSYYEKSISEHLPGCGLLSEEMGLGKTVEVTTLIRLHPRPLTDLESCVSLQFKEGGDFRMVKKAKTTLIAAPDSIIRQWYSEICQICPSLSVTIYKGLGKYPELNNIPQYIAEFLQSYDVVLLNYATLSKETDYANYSSRHKPTRGGKKRNIEESEEDSGGKNASQPLVSASTAEVDTYKAEFRLPEFNNQQNVALSQRKYERKVMTDLAEKIARRDLKTISHTQYYESPLMSCQWWRVVLDEVQMVSSGSTKAFATAAILPRFHSWGVSGTPSTSPAVLQFLRFSPFNYDNQKYCWKLLTAFENTNEDFVRLWSSLAIRHTKSMVFSDIQLPPQQRVLLTVPFTEVEQDKYEEVMESTLAYIGINDIKTVAKNHSSIESSKYSHLRTSLFRLRQLCGNLQVGKLPKTHTLRGRNKTKLMINGTKELKTLSNVLHDMIESVDDEILECEKLLINQVLEICSTLEYVLYPEKVIEVIEILLEGIKNFMSEASKKTDADKLKYKVLRAQMKENHKHEQLMLESSDEDDMGTSARVGNRQVIMNDDEAWESSPDLQKLKDRIATSHVKHRSWQMIQHKCYFLLASAHFQLYDPEYQDKIATLRVPFEAIHHLTEVITNCGLSKWYINTPTRIADRHNASDQRVSGIDSIQQNKLFEKKYYELAEECRRSILNHSMRDVDSVTTKRIRSKGLLSPENWINNGQKLFPKSTKKLFNVIPRIEGNFEALISDIRHRHIIDQFRMVVTQLNGQADVINTFVEELLIVLTNPLNNTEKDADGEEFEQSVQDQEQASCLMLVISQSLIDRSNAVSESKTQITEVERQQENELRQEAHRVNDRKYLKELQTARLSARPNLKITMEECIEDARLLDIEAKNSSRPADRSLSTELYKILRTIFENEKTGQNLLKKELNASFNAVFNSRVEYFRQLQQISDSVKNDAFNFDREKVDADALNLIFQGLYHNLAAAQNKLAKSTTRARYLSTLVPSHTSEGAGESRDEPICIICQSSITVGSLTFCGHRFCKECLEEWLKRSPYCPVCKAHINRHTVYGFTQYRAELKAQSLDRFHDIPHEDSGEKRSIHSIYKQLDDETLNKVQGISLANSYGSKVDLIVKQILFLRGQDARVQIVIFSQWQDLLVILAIAFEKSGITYVSAKGSHVTVNNKRKSDPVEEFKDQTNIKTCFLLNAQAQSSGLTLTNATHIFLCEPMINTSTELQAISRIHRIGQERETSVWMFAIENSVEENIVALGSKRRLDYYKANAKDGGGANVTKQEINNNTELQENELRAAESFALTVGNSSGKKVTENTEYVGDEDLYKVYFGMDT
ncbi:hypothetical protein OXX79_001921 [Metschnikowia pulcherrima]